MKLILTILFLNIAGVFMARHRFQLFPGRSLLSLSALIAGVAYVLTAFVIWDLSDHLNPSHLTMISIFSFGMSTIFFLGILHFSRSLRVMDTVNETRRDKEKFLESLMANLPIIVFALDKDGKLMFFEGKGLEIIKYPIQDFLGKSVFEIFPHLTGALDKVREALQGKAGFETVVGRFGTFDVWMEPYKDEKGNNIGVFGVGTNVTERTKVEDALRESEQKYRGLTETAHDFIFMVGKDEKVMYVNSFAAQQFRKKKEEIVGRNLTDLFPPLVCERMLKNLKTVMETGNPVYIEDKVVFPHGGLWLDSRLIPMKNQNNEIYGVLGVSRDTTARRNAEEALSAEKERLSVTLRNIGDGVVSTDVEGNIILMNQVAENLCGFTQEEAQGKPFHQIFFLFSEKNQKPQEHLAVRFLKGDPGDRFSSGTFILRSHGKDKTVACSWSPLLDPKNKTVGAIVCLRDVSHQKRMEEYLSQSQRLESLGVLAGGIAHDFNNILTVIIGNISLIKIFQEKGMPIGPKLEEAEKASFRARDLTQQLLTFSKAGAPSKKAASITDLIRESADFALRGAKAKCDYRFTENTWTVEIDESQISRVISNMVINANQAMPDGGVIVVSVENCAISEDSKVPVNPGKFVVMRVIDQGIGIPPEIQTKIFDPYFTTKNTGSGLGLAICHSIIRRHNGHILVESTPGKGTTFSVFIPASPNSKVPARETSDHQYIGSGRILIMDDNESIRTVAGETLKMLGFEAEFAADGASAVRLYKAAMETGNPFAAVIIDLIIPGGMGGKETVTKLLEIDPNVKAIVSSGYSVDPIMSEYRQHGFLGVIKKPYLIGDVKNCLQEILGKGQVGEIQKNGHA